MVKMKPGEGYRGDHSDYDEGAMRYKLYYAMYNNQYQNQSHRVMGDYP